MKTKQKKAPRVKIVTLGCAKNKVDSENVFTQLHSNGIDVFHEDTSKQYDIAILNTCGFIEDAKQESLDTILAYTQAKQEGHLEKVYVTGCLSERYREELSTQIPEVDAWFGTRELSRLLKQFRVNYKHELVGERIVNNPCHYAYMKISEGCNRPCSFCAIPLMRGNHVSRPIEELVNEAKKLTEKGTKELLLIAQDSTYYGLDLYKKSSLNELLKRLSDVEGIAWIRIHYAFPTGFPLEILDTMATHSNICNYLDMPLQHGSSKMLRRMRRGMSQEKMTRLLSTIREKVPGIALRTTLMVGHPGETEKDFDDMMNFVEQSRFERLGTFTYSHEENTHSHSMPDDVPAKVKQQRMDTLMALQQKISLEINQTKIGKKLKVLIDQKEENNYIGRTEFDSPDVDNEVILNTDGPSLQAGDFTDAIISDATEFDLIGSPVTTYSTKS